MIQNVELGYHPAISMSGGCSVEAISSKFVFPLETLGEEIPNPLIAHSSLEFSSEDDIVVVKSTEPIVQNFCWVGKQITFANS